MLDGLSFLHPGPNMLVFQGGAFTVCGFRAGMAESGRWACGILGNWESWNNRPGFPSRITVLLGLLLYTPFAVSRESAGYMPSEQGSGNLARNARKAQRDSVPR